MNRFRGLLGAGLMAAALLGLHLIPAAVMIPTLTQSLRNRSA